MLIAPTPIERVAPLLPLTADAAAAEIFEAVRGEAELLTDDLEDLDGGE